MGSIFGILRLHDAEVAETELRPLAATSTLGVPDGLAVAVCGPVGMGRQFYRTHESSFVRSDPIVDPHGNVLAFDGRLDNAAELCEILELDRKLVSASELVLAAFVRWQEACFSRLIGDWAFALWCKREKTLYLARDHAGTRTLFFEQGPTEIRWSSYLDSFRTDTRARELSECFILHSISGHPQRDRTPYETIRAVLPAHYVRFASNGMTSGAHWRWSPQSRLSYRVASEYEEQFFSLFKQAVARRTEVGTPLLAQLSGGMDSTSIVCMCDHIRSTSSHRDQPKIDTISYYSESEPDWDERPYFSVTEESRGKTGLHVCAAPSEIDLEPPSHWPHFPGSTNARAAKERQLEEAIGERGYRAILSGIGGDELLGGVPTPLPELADYFVSGDWKSLFRQTLTWSIYQRSPMIHMFGDVMRFLHSIYVDPTLGSSAFPPWFTQNAKETDRALLELHLSECRSYSQLPSAVSNAVGWWCMLETLPHLFPAITKRYEYRYPYLDRDLVDFLLRVPRSQLAEPGRRRSLMRRALASIVPKEILERRRKAFISRGNIRALQMKHEAIRAYFRSSHLLDRGLIDRSEFFQALDRVVAGGNEWSRQLVSTIACEVWLRRVHDPMRSPPAKSCLLTGQRHPFHVDGAHSSETEIQQLR